MLWHVFHKTLMTEPLHKQSYDKFVKRISNMQQLTSNFLKKCAFRPHSRAEPGLHAPPLQVSVPISQKKSKVRFWTSTFSFLTCSQSLFPDFCANVLFDDSLKPPGLHFLYFLVTFWPPFSNLFKCFFAAPQKREIR